MQLLHLRVPVLPLHHHFVVQLLGGLLEGKFLLLIELVGLLQALAAVEPFGALQERMHVVVVVLLVAQVTEIVLATVIAPVVFCASPSARAYAPVSHRAQSHALMLRTRGGHVCARQAMARAAGYIRERPSPLRYFWPQCSACVWPGLTAAGILPRCSTASAPRASSSSKWPPEPRTTATAQDSAMSALPAATRRIVRTRK